MARAEFCQIFRSFFGLFRFIDLYCTTNFAVWKMKLLTQHDQIERLREFYLNIPVELNSDFTSIQNKQKKCQGNFDLTENIKLFILIGHDLTEDGFDCNM